MKNKLTVKSSIKEMAKELWKMKLTFKEAQTIGWRIGEECWELKERLKLLQGLSDETFKNRDIKRKLGFFRNLKKVHYIKQFKQEIDRYRSINHYFYPFTKYDMVKPNKKERKIIINHKKRVKAWWKKQGAKK